MTRFTTDGLPRPVIIQEPDYEPLFQRRLGEYVDGIIAAGGEYDVGTLETDDAAIAAQAAAYGDLYTIEQINDAGRVVLLPSFAEGTDLDLHAERAGIEARFVGEGDAALRERIRLGWKSKSAAGPDDYYKSKARDLDIRVKDVAVTAETRDSSSRVLILSVLTTDNGGLLDNPLKARLTTALNDPSFRSRNVTVEVIAAVLLTQDVAYDIYLYPETPESVVELGRQALITAANADRQLGFDVTRSYVEKHLHRSGVQRVELKGWNDAYAGFNQAIRLGDVTPTIIRLAL